MAYTLWERLRHTDDWGNYMYPKNGVDSRLTIHSFIHAIRIAFINTDSSGTSGTRQWFGDRFDLDPGNGFEEMQTIIAEFDAEPIVSRQRWYMDKLIAVIYLFIDGKITQVEAENYLGIPNIPRATTTTTLTTTTTVPPLPTTTTPEPI